jgi:hypothetical protein
MFSGSLGRMRVAVVRLYEAIRKTAWKHGFFASERIRHEIAADGSHRIELTLKADEVEYQAPARPETGAALLGHGTGTNGEGKTKR